MKTRPALTVQEVLARLETQAASLQEKAAYHRAQEDHHRGLRERYDAEAEAASRRLEQFRGAAVSAMELAVDGMEGLPVAAAKPLGPQPAARRLIGEAVQAFAPGEPFGASKVLQEIERRYGDSLKRLPDPEHVSIALRRMGESGRLHRIRRGKPHWEALYVRETPAGG